MPSGHYDRRGFDTILKVNLALIVLALPILYFSILAGILIIMFLMLAFVTFQTVSAPPVSRPVKFVTHARRSGGNRQPVLVCLGDDHVQTNNGEYYGITTNIAAALRSRLGMQDTKNATHVFSEPLWVVNAGQNCLTTEALLKEQRLNSALNCYPDFMLVWVGLSDVRAMCKNTLVSKRIVTVNNMSKPPTIESFERNLNSIIDYIQQSSPVTKIGIATLPPIGENLNSQTNTQYINKCNEIIANVARKHENSCSVVPVNDKMQEILEKERRNKNKTGDPATSIITPIISFICDFLYANAAALYFSRNKLSSLITGNVLFYDGIHLNERASDAVVQVIVDWLISRNVAKAIAVKRVRSLDDDDDDDDDDYIEVLDDNDD